MTVKTKILRCIDGRSIDAVCRLLRDTDEPAQILWLRPRCRLDHTPLNTTRLRGQI